MLNSKQGAPALEESRKQELFSFMEKAGFEIDSLDLLNLALTHSSYANENGLRDDNERLEFLGDSVLGLIASDFIYSGYKDLREGDYSKIKSVIVSESSLAEFASSVSLGDYLLLGAGETKSFGNHKKAILADATEALIAAIYIDSGIDGARKFILPFISSQIERYLSGHIPYRDYKTVLQEYYQKKKGRTPKYELISTEGPDHEHVFKVMVILGTKEFGPGEGSNKKEAEQCAAKIALVSLGLMNE